MDAHVPELRDTLGVLWRRKLIVVAAIAATTAGALWYSLNQPKLYEARSRLLVRPVVAGAAFSGTASSGNGGPLGLDLAIETQSEIVRSPVVASRVVEELDLEVRPEALAGAISVKAVTEELLQITASSRSPRLSARLADGFAEQYLAYRRDAATSALLDLSRDLKRRLDSIQERVLKLDARIVTLSSDAARIAGAKPPLTPAQAAAVAAKQAETERVRAERNELLIQMGEVRTRYDDVRTAQVSSSGGGAVVDHAVVPLGATSPKPARDGVVGLLLGAMLGVGLAFLREHFDDRIRTHADAASAGGVTVAGTIPRAPRWRRRRDAYLVSVREPGSPAAEAYRALRQSLSAMGVGREAKTVLVTSGGARAGKSSTAANLAIAFAQSGLRVVAISADLRKPRLHAFLGVSNDAGLSQLLSDERAVVGMVALSNMPNLRVLPSGAPPRGGVPLLEGRRLDAVLRKIGPTADVIIIDAPPISSGADALVLAPHADVTVLVMRQEMARVSGTAAAVGDLNAAGAERVVAVMNLASSKIVGHGYAREVAFAPAFAPVHTNGNGSSGNGHHPVAQPVDHDDND